MEIRENYTVRKLDLVMDRDERKKYNEILEEYIEDGGFVNFGRSGPLTDGNKIIPGKFHHTIEIEEERACDFVKELKNLWRK